jgi:peptide chain release factor 1
LAPAVNDERLRAIEQELRQVESSLSEPGVHDDQARYASIARRYSELQPVAAAASQLLGRRGDLETARSMEAESTCSACTRASRRARGGSSRC